ncbi:G-protein-signaling modulator 2 isoform X2 [Anthonomus grandis grandis]|uniref:G-protein-signaling modulator 2 isoform X2 n=1 Tax=Anthonomus grandis grandis TaxID=2921223 RepID=UPI00216605D9|nr:G-protein-signaling modulator 2 isoform X2 [Anthonomus grandis grandis]
MSVATGQESVENAVKEYDGSSNMCLELALEGERLCKSGDCRAGVAFFQAAIQAGTDDLRTLSAIYSQLGNAYFYLGDYGKAMQYHKHDLTLARTMGDKLGEAKSSGNLGNTLKVMGKFDEAIVCCKRHLELARELDDKLSEGRALYNLGNVFHAKGKHAGRIGQKDPGEFSDEVKECLQEAVSYYEENLRLMRDLGDVAAQGRACGNLGNTHYLLGDFGEAVKYHAERLSIARQFGDKPAERRAHSNLGNSHIFMGQFEEAAEHYQRTLALAQELADQAVQAQACYSLGNTYTLLRDYEKAIEYHLRHLLIAQNLNDRVGEGRACWSLGNAHASLGHHEKALEFARQHYEISREINDPVGEATAKMNISDLKKILDLPESPDSPEEVRKVNGEELTPDGKNPPPGSKTKQLVNKSKKAGTNGDEDEEESFFDMLSRFQSKRMDEQRCSLALKRDGNKENKNTVNNLLPKNEEPDEPEDELFNMITGMQSNRMDEQRVELPNLPGLQPPRRILLPNEPADPPQPSSVPDDRFLDQLVRCQNSRLDDQRSPLPPLDPPLRNTGRPVAAKVAPTVPDEDFFSLIMRLQSSGRMDDQRATPLANRNQNRMANGTAPHQLPPNSVSTGSNTKKSTKKK